MGKTLWSSLILQATLILLLNSSHARTNDLDDITPKSLLDNSITISKKDALDIANIVYNLHSKEANISNIMSNNLKVVYNMVYGEVELRPTTCTRAESVLDECLFKTNLDRMHDSENEIEYLKLKWNQNEKTCSKFQSELSNCPFSEHLDKQKGHRCWFRIFSEPLGMNVISIFFMCRNI